MGHVSQFYLSLLRPPLKLLCFEDQATIIIAFLHLLYLPLQSRALRWYLSFVLLPQFLQVIRLGLDGHLLLCLLVAFDLASFNLVADVLLEEPVVLFSFFFGVDFRLRVRVSRGGNGRVLFTISDAIGCCVLSSALFVGVDDLFYLVPLRGIYGGFVTLLDFQTVGLLLHEDGLLFCLLLSLFCLSVHHFLKHDIAELPFVYLFIQLLLEQVLLLPCQFYLCFLPFPVLSLQFLVSLLMHF